MRNNSNSLRISEDCNILTWGSPKSVSLNCFFSIHSLDYKNKTFTKKKKAEKRTPQKWQKISFLTPWGNLWFLWGISNKKKYIQFLVTLVPSVFRAEDWNVEVKVTDKNNDGHKVMIMFHNPLRQVGKNC